MSDPHRGETVVDRQIRLAMERGAFDNLPGKGKPLPGLDGEDDELWWVRSYIEREGLSRDALLPPAIQLRKAIDRLPETLRNLATEDDVRTTVRELNLQIADYIRSPGGPPRLHIAPVRIERALEQWHASRPAPEPPPPAPPRQTPPEPHRRRAWFRRRP